jgi:hypothetical protein
VARVTGLWVYQRFGKTDPEAVAERAQIHGLRWLTAEAIDGVNVLDHAWLRAMRRATKKRGMRLGVHGLIGRVTPHPTEEAKAMARAIEVAEADFAIVNAEDGYRDSPNPDSRAFVDAYRDRKPDFLSYFSSYGRPDIHRRLDWAAWANGGFRGMPQAYENLNATKLKPRDCVDAWAQFFDRSDLRPTLGCFRDGNDPRLPIPRLVQSVREVPGLSFNIYRHGTVTPAELQALAALI